MANILITAPSLNENINISGISSLTKTIIAKATKQNYFHFTIGKKDGDGKGLKWIFHQILLVPRFIRYIKANKIDFIHLNTDFTPASILRDYFLSAAVSRIAKKTILMHIHGGYLLMSPPKKNSFLFRLIKGMLQFASIRVVLSEVEQKQILHTYGISCAVIPNAVESIKERAKKDFSGKLSLLFMGRIVKAKGIFLLADSLKGLSQYFSEISLKVYGAGPDLEAFQSELASIPGLNFQYCGIAKGKEKVAALQDAHIFLLPSLYGEGLPIAMLESMNYGCVPIVSDDASIGTVVKDGLNGYLVSKGQIDELQSKLIQVFENRNELAALSENATKTIDTTYNLDSYMKTLNALYTNYNPSN